MNDLARSRYIENVRGRGGGIRLGRAPEEINIGTLVRHTEGGFDLVGCASCVIAPACSLTSVLKEALCAFLAVLDRYSLADLMDKRQDMGLLLAETAFSQKPADDVRA
ncbi:Rrf2 family transcriptional regulator [Sphingobium sp. S8]|uniref:Rrf2 family transcriptional regulator n=1 Tax=Sphingobium sp. S8 TaxID=2758385 RepID=UPI003FA75AB5